MNINPLPPALLEELKKKELVIVPELNHLGQFSMVLRSKGINAVSITQITGLPFKFRDLVNWIGDRVREQSERTVQV